MTSDDSLDEQARKWRLRRGRGPSRYEIKQASDAAFLERAISGVANKKQDKANRELQQIVKYKHLWTKDDKSGEDSK